MYKIQYVHKFIGRLLPAVEYCGGDGGNANCGQSGYGGCSPGFGGDTAYTNDWAGTWHNHRDLIANNSGYSSAPAQHRFQNYGYRGYLYGDPSDPFNSNPGNIDHDGPSGHD